MLGRALLISGGCYYLDGPFYSPFIPFESLVLLVLGLLVGAPGGLIRLLLRDDWISDLFC